jgi:HK97 family phage major capsid protein
MKLTLKADYVGIKSGSVIDVDDGIANELITKGTATEVIKVIEQKDVKPVQKTVPNFTNASEYLRAQAKHLAGLETDVRLKASLGQGEDSAAVGGALVTHPIYDDEIYNAITTEAVLAPKCRQIKITMPNANGILIPQVNAPTLTAAAGLFGGVKVYNVAEAGAITPTTAAYTQKDVTLGKLAAIIPATREILQDRSAFETLIYAQLKEALAWYIDDSILNNTLGVMTTPIVGSAATVAVTFAGAAPTLEELAKFWIAVMPSARKTGEWFISNSMYSKLLVLKTSPTVNGSNYAVQGLPMFQTSFADAAKETLFGRPINVITQATADSTAGCFGFYDLKNYALVTKGEVIQDSNISLYYLSDQELFRVILRISGTPLQATKVTLADGTVVGNFVTRN